MKNNVSIKKEKNHSFRTLLFVLIASFITAALLYYFHDRKETEQSLTYFPDDPTLTFKIANTSLHFKSGSPFTIQWAVSSEINDPTYLRQDVSFLFKDQKLIGILSKWEEDTDKLSQSKMVKGNQSGYFESISVHHAENHYPNNIIKGKETMSFDHLSVIKVSDDYTSFKIPTQPEEKRWYKNHLQKFRLKEKSMLSQAAKKYHFNLNQYFSFPLTHLHVYNDQPLPGLDQNTTHRVVSELWEGIYKNYSLGIHLTEQDLRDPIGSMMPVILYSKKADHILIIIQLDTGEMAMLEQVIHP